MHYLEVQLYLLTRTPIRDKKNTLIITAVPADWILIYFT